MEHEFEWFRPFAVGVAVMFVAWLVVGVVDWIVAARWLDEAEDESVEMD